MGNESSASHPNPDDSWGAEDHDHKPCRDCGIRIDGLDYVSHVNPGNDHKLYYQYEFSRATQSITVGGGFGLSTGGSVNRSETVVMGTPMIKMWRQDGSSWRCTGCMEKFLPNEFRSAAISLKGMAAIINSDFTLNKATFGDF